MKAGSVPSSLVFEKRVFTPQPAFSVDLTLQGPNNSNLFGGLGPLYFRHLRGWRGSAALLLTLLRYIYGIYGTRFCTEADAQYAVGPQGICDAQD